MPANRCEDQVRAEQRSGVPSPAVMWLAESAGRNSTGVLHAQIAPGDVHSFTSGYSLSCVSVQGSRQEMRIWEMPTSCTI